MEPQSPVTPETQPPEATSLPQQPVTPTVPTQPPTPVVPIQPSAAPVASAQSPAVQPPMPSKRSKLLIPIIMVVVLLVVGSIWFFMKNNKQSASTSDKGTSQTQGTSSGEAKADKVVEALKAKPKDSNPFSMSDEIKQLNEEVNAYAKKNENPNLTKNERLAEATGIGVSLGLYNSTFRDGQVKKLSSQATAENDKVVITKYSLENPNSKALKGPYEVVITTAYLDGDWRLVDFTVTKI